MRTTSMSKVENRSHSSVPTLSTKSPVECSVSNSPRQSYILSPFPSTPSSFLPLPSPSSLTSLFVFLGSTPSSWIVFAFFFYRFRVSSFDHLQLLPVCHVLFRTHPSSANRLRASECEIDANSKIKKAKIVELHFTPLVEPYRRTSITLLIRYSHHHDR